MTARRKRSFPGPGQRGLTLLELLLVVFILSSIALVTVSIVDSADEQLRYEDTRARLELVKKGIIGDPSITVNNQPLISGFVADMGVLPNFLQELIERGPLPDDLLIPEWQFLQFDADYPQYGLWAGWRGPYLEALLEKDTNGFNMHTFRDGWDNPGTAPFYGWKIFSPQDNNSLTMQSYGSDGKEGGNGYAEDYPQEPTILEVHDYLIDVRPLKIDVKATSSFTSSIDIHLKLFYPELDENYNLIPSYKESNPVSIKPGFGTYQFSFLKTSDPNDPELVPWGVRYIVVFDETHDKYRFDVTPPLEIRLIPRSALPTFEQTWTFGISSGQPGKLQNPP